MPRNLIVIPAWNEADSIARVLGGLEVLPEGFEIIVINDGSLDATADIASEVANNLPLPCRIVSLAFNAGIGVAVQTGYQYAVLDGGFDYVIQFDGDGQHDPGYIVPLVDACESEAADLCVGSRFLGSGRGDRSTVCRRIGISVIRFVIRLLTGRRLTDPTSGFRCAGRRAWSSFAKIYPDDYPEPESLVWCLRNGLRTIEVPVEMQSRLNGRSSIGRLQGLYYLMKVTCALVLDRCRSREVPS
ncbi:MAG: glycosyltransferase family 2 protein [Parvibaculaceae bacterium]